jgi:D-alanyl-D-alanine carboxypeptidase
MVAENDMDDSDLIELGIPSDYGRDPFRPRYAEASALVDVEPNVLGRMQRLVPETARDWLAMKAAAHDDGVELLLVSGFRSIDYQTALLRRKLAAGQDIATILSASAAPGFSQHHTGRTIDLATPGSRPLTTEFETTAAFAWLGRCAGDFGFRLPYRRDNRFGFDYEPWHWTQLDE